ncbi:beta-ketoacyl-ACP synthase 3 [Streptomyces sp. NPDC058872]|uniref:beta-ketoacyl-ACP synthase 3 n=1 Tax=Streptomyces sp. NPDC058872 TaxID=3346661 RepID=UPI003697B8A9
MIDGVGGALPRRVVSNDELTLTGLDTSHQWIAERTGIHNRHWAAPEISTGDLAAAAAENALASCPTGASGIGLLLLATTTPDRRCPATAPEVAARIGLSGVAAFDVAAACAGFLYALAVGDAWIRSGAAQRVLVVGADTLTRIIDPQDRDTAVLFGDGAGAVVLRTGHPGEPGALHSVVVASDGTRSDLISIAAGGARQPYPPDVSPHEAPVPRGERFVRMRGREVFGQAVRQMSAASEEVLKRSGWSPESLGAFIGHQANQRILDAVAERLNVPPASRLGNIRDVGNTSSASIPLVLAETLSQGSVSPGSRTLLTAFGGGLAWGAATLTWPTSRQTSTVTHI